MCVGNTAYLHPEHWPEVGGAEDAKAVANSLKTQGFSTSLLSTNSSVDSFRETLGQLLFTIGGTCEPMAVIYFAGHGVHCNGQDFLVHVDAGPLGHCLESCVSLAEILEACESVAWSEPASSRWSTTPAIRPTFLILLDCCRSPVSGFDTQVPRLRAFRKADFFVTFACDPGRAALEVPSNARGRLTEAFLEAVAHSQGKTVNEVMEEVQQHVACRTLTRQRPWVLQCCRRASETAFVSRVSTGIPTE